MKLFQVSFTMEGCGFFKTKTFFIKANNEYDAGTCTIAGECHKPAHFTDVDKHTAEDSLGIVYAVDEVKEILPEYVSVIESVVDVFDYDQSWVDAIQPYQGE